MSQYTVGYRCVDKLNKLIKAQKTETMPYKKVTLCTRLVARIAMSLMLVKRRGN